jgi:modulator of FtsH protease HflK
MNADDLSYRQASLRSLWGSAIHAVLGLVLLVVGLLIKDHAVVSGALWILLGLIVWGTLWFLFDLHRRERLEASEAQALAASDPLGSSVFEGGAGGGAGEHRPLAKRLQSMHGYAIPFISLAYAAALIGVGWYRLSEGRVLAPLDNWVKHIGPRGAQGSILGAGIGSGWAIGLGIGVAFVGFLLARYASGMAKHPAWSNLRAGAAASAAMSLVGLLIAIAHIVFVVGPDAPLRYLHMVLPIAMIVIGLEVVLNFVLELYRPRKAGETPRAVFESRLLGLAAAPDQLAQSVSGAINYQLGFNITGGWWYRLLSRSLWRLGALALLLIWGMSSLVVILPHQQGLVLRFGALSRTVDPGLHFKWPWPIERVSIPTYVVKDAEGKASFSSSTVTGVRTLQVGTAPATGGLKEPILWTTKHGLTEDIFIVQPAALVFDAQASGAGPGPVREGYEAIAIEVPVLYSVADLEAFEKLGTPEMRDEMLQSVAQRELTWYLSGLSLSDVLSERRTAIAAELRARIERAFAKLNPMGNGQPVVRVLSVAIQGVHPPQETAQAFEDVVGAEQKSLAQLEDARATRITTLNKAVGTVELAEEVIGELDALDRLESEKRPEDEVNQQRLKVRGLIERAGGEAASIILTASADRWSRVFAERTRLTEYVGQLSTYLAAPQLYTASLYFDAIRESMSGARVFITDPQSKLRLVYDVKDNRDGGAAFNPGDEDASR